VDPQLLFSVLASSRTGRRRGFEGADPVRGAPAGYRHFVRAATRPGHSTLCHFTGIEVLRRPSATPCSALESSSPVSCWSQRLSSSPHLQPWGRWRPHFELNVRDNRFWMSIHPNVRVRPRALRSSPSADPGCSDAGHRTSTAVHSTFTSAVACAIDGAPTTFVPSN
jgi:hypothetical protein